MNASQSEINLEEITEIIISKWKLIAIIPILSAIIAFLIINFLPKTWEGEAIIQIGQSSLLTTPNRGSIIESPDQVIQSISSNIFKAQLQTQKQISLKAIIIPNTNLISIKVRGPSPDTVKDALTQSVANIASTHQAIIEPDLNKAKIRLIKLNEKIKVIDVEIQNLYKKLITQNNNTNAILIELILQNKKKDLGELEIKQQELERQLSPLSSFPTRLIDMVNVPEKPALPKRNFIIAITYFLTLLFTITIILLASIYNNIQKHVKKGE